MRAVPIVAGLLPVGLLTGCTATAAPSPNEATAAQTFTAVPPQTQAAIPDTFALSKILILDELGVAYIEGFIFEWDMMGATPENRKSYFTSGGDFEITNDIVAQNAEIMANSLFVIETNIRSQWSTFLLFSPRASGTVMLVSSVVAVPVI